MDAAPGQGAVLADVEDPDVPGPAVGDVEPLLVVGEQDPVGAAEAVGGELDLAVVRVDPVEVAGADLALGDVALVVAGDAEVRVGEPDRAVRTDHRVVGRVEPLALEVTGEDGDRAVVLGAGHPAVALLTGDQAALAVEGVAVAVPGHRAEDADRPGGLVPAQDPVVGDVAPDQLPPRGHVERALGPAAVPVELLEPGVPVGAGAEAVVQDLVQPELNLTRHHSCPIANGRTWF